MEVNSAELAQKQLDAYNEQNLEEFLAVYSEDVEILEFPSNKVMYTGISKMRERYGNLFEENPEQKAELLGRIAEGNIVIDHERVTGRANGSVVHAVAIYETKEGKISKVWFKK